MWGKVGAFALMAVGVGFAIVNARFAFGRDDDEDSEGSDRLGPIDREDERARIRRH